MIKKLLYFALILITADSFSAKVDTVRIFSKSMNKELKAVVITPDNYSKAATPFPVLYLLHGYSDNYGAWVKKATVVPALSDLYNTVVVCPDGGFGSWYYDSPIDPSFKFETFAAKEVVEWTDKNYNTIKDRKGRAITGLSMGGHGALYLAFKHPEVFGAAGSMSGGVDIRPFPNNWDVAKRLGKYSTHPQNWEQMTVINLVHLVEPNSLRIIVDCGTEDFFFEVNQNFHQKLKERNIAHEYIVRPGAHNWEYWNNAIKYQMLFFSEGWKK